MCSAVCFAPSSRASRGSDRARHHPRAGAGAQPHTRRIRAHRSHARQEADVPRAGHFLRLVERALLLQAFAAGPQDIPHDGTAGRPGAGGERRRVAAPERLGGRVQDRIPQPPVRGRALPGGGHGCRRDSPRRLHDGSPPRRPAQRPPLRPARRGAQSLFVRGRGARDRRLRQLRRRAHARRRGRFRVRLFRQPAGERHVRRRAEGEGADQGRRARCRQHPPRRRLEHGPRRHPWRVVRIRGADARERAAPPPGPGRRSVRGKAAARSEPRADRLRAHRRHSGHGRRGVGVEIDLSKVPTREPGMTPYEILLSESQERMLVVAKTDRVKEVQAIAAKWELAATPIGKVTDDGMYRCTWQGKVVVEIPGQTLVDDAPVYYPEAKEDPRIAELRAATPTHDARRTSPKDALLQLLDAPSVASKKWVFEQYDSTVQASTVIAPGGDAGVVRVRHEDFGIAVKTDCNSRYVRLDPYEGGKATVAESARNVACTGARPLGITDCLNFGSPERPAVFYQFREACRGIADACRALGTPVTGGNVSFYNESPTGAVDPTPVVGMIGLLTRADRAVPSHARA